MSMPILIGGGLVVLILVVGFLTFISKYKTVSPDQALIVTGSYLGNRNVISSDPDSTNPRRVKIISGGVSTPEVYTEEGVPIMADATAIIKVGGTMEDIFSAAEQYLGKPVESLRLEAQEVLEGHLRSILGSMTVEEIYKDRKKFASEVQEVAHIDLKKMGLTIVSFTIKDVRDKNGYLDALGKPRIAAVKRDAQIAEAEANKEAAVKRAQNDEHARRAEITKETAIAEAEKDMELKKAAFKKEQDTAKAVADAAYGIQQATSEQSVIEAKMKAQQIQKEKDIELAEKESLRRQKELEGTIMKQADADLYRRTKDAEAARIEQETKAAADAESLRLQAEADANAKKARATAEAEAERAKGTAAADVERAKGKATADAEISKTEILKAQGEMEAAAEKARIDNLSAEGQATAFAIEAKGIAEARVFEAKAKAEVEKEMGLAEAALKLGQLRFVELITAVLPEIAGKIAEPMGNIDKITIIDTNSEGGGGMGKITGQVTNLMKFLPEVVEDMTGIKLSDVLSGLTKGRLSGEAFDPVSFPNLLKSLEGVDSKALEAVLKNFNPNKAEGPEVE
ncbi:flotillin family protein [Paenibacillus sepulcri]|uniref:Flotillin family protein n=1 Tax=Paenibacillus sepulcri TaxID=359917 RepID=A0ABS7BVA1_9BACL|nr:flotillin family protein [Paenibacillus sepulcri]